MSAPTIDLLECEREPIHAPGAIQPHGCFLAAELAHFTITHASANTLGVLGRAPHEVLGQSAASVVGASTLAILAAGIEAGALPATHWAPSGGGGPVLRMHSFPTGELMGIDIEPLPAVPAAALYTVQALAEQLKAATSAVQLCELAVHGLRGLTGYDRVLAYHFHQDGHGEVVAEDRRPGVDSFLGLRFPASDVPPQAHALYLRKLVAVIADTEAVPVEIIEASRRAAPGSPSQAPLDLTESDLRAVSPRHLQYMRNMNTAAALRIGLPDGEKLWGLFLCHHLSPRLPAPGQRAAAALLGQIAALRLRHLASQQLSAQLAARRALLGELARRLAAPERFPEILRTVETELLGLAGASGALVYYDHAPILIGETPPEQACLQILATLRPAARNDLAAISHLTLLHPELKSCARLASGALLLPLTPAGDDAILWFRPEQTRAVLWGGNPAEHAVIDEATGQLGPRRSFAAWQEISRGRCEPWSEADQALARELRSTFAAAAADKMKAQLVRLRDYDSVTGLPKWERLQRWLAEPGRLTDARIAIIAIDLGNLTEFDLTLGASGVKALVVEIAQRLLPFAGETSLASRHGDAEFLVLMLGLEPVEIKARAAFIRQAIELPYLIEGQTIQLRPTYRYTYADEAEGRDLGGAAGMAIASAKAAGAFKRQVETQRQKMEGLGRMMGGIAHEINNMLQPVTLLGQDLLDRGALAPEAAETMGIILECNRQACHIIGDVLAFARPTGRSTARHNPAALLRDKLRLVRQAVPHGVRLATEITDGLPPIMANPTAFAQILVNLATNAAAAMAGAGTLTVALTSATDNAQDSFMGGARPWVQLVVSDTGCGMDRATLERAFEPFFTTKAVGLGTGLGLPVVFGLVEEMSGTITLASEPGAGTTVTIRLPAAPEPDTEPA